MQNAIADRNPAAVAPPITMRGAIVPLLALAIFINYADRGNVSTAAPLIKAELGLSATQIGILLSAFYWIYVPSQLLAGWLLHRINAYRTLAAGLALWSVATGATGLANTFVELLVLRLLLGLGESAAFPCLSRLLAQHVPAERLGAANGITLVGLGLGPAFGTFAGGLLMASFGWRNLFLLFGFISSLWLLPWWASTRHLEKGAARNDAGHAPSFLVLLGRREVRGTILGHFCGLYSFYFVISWLPLYLVKARGLSLQHMGEIGGLIYLVYAASTLISGYLADCLIKAGFATNRVRKAGAIGSLLVSAASLFAAAYGDATTSIISLFCAAAAFGLGTSNVYTIPQTLAGPHAAGQWVALQNSIGNIAGIVAPIITGEVVDRTGTFFWAFVVAGAASALGILGWGVMIPKVAPLDWSTRGQGPALQRQSP